MIRIKIRTAMMGAMALLALGAINLTALAADPLKLESIDVQTLSGQQVQLKLHMSGPAPEPLPFTIDKPARIAFDLPNTTLAVASRRIDVRSGGVDTVLAAEANGRTRLVVNVDNLMPYTTQIDGNTIVIMLGNVPAGTAAPAAVGPCGQRPARRGGGTRDPHHRFQARRRRHRPRDRAADRSAHRRERAPGRQSSGRRLRGTLMPKNLMRRYDVMDFATPVQTVDALRVEGSSRLVISAQGDFEQLAYQSDNQYTIEIKPSLKRANAEEKKEYTGERLTLNFQDIDVRSVLQLLADTSGQNIVVSDSVTGNLTLRLQNVPWDQALDIVLRTKGLDKRRQDNVIIIGPTAELASREKAELAARKEVQDLSPVRTEFMQVNYAKVSDLAKLIKPTGGASTVNSMLSPRGTISIDERTNTLLVQDTADKLSDIRRLVQTLDVPVKQVLIEARIVIVSDTFERDLGAKLGITGFTTAGPGSLISVTGNGTGADTMTQSAITNLGNGGSVRPVTTPILDNRYQVNVPAAHTNGSIGLSVLGGSHIIDLELSARAKRGQERNHLLAARHHGEPEAGHHHAGCGDSLSGIGVERRHDDPVQERGAVAEGDSADHPGQPRHSRPRCVRRLGGTAGDQRHGRHRAVDRHPGDHHPGAGQRRPDRRSGRILDTTKSLSANKVPFFADIPVLGNLFKSTTRVNNKTELLIFITPKILREGSNLY